MADSPNKLKTYELINPMETFPGLTVDDLNRYLPAIRTVEDMSITKENMQEGMFLTKCIDGLQQLPDQSIDLIIANPPKDNWDTTLEQGKGNTLQEYYQWNQLWLSESHRVLNKTGAIYILCPWQYSGMYQGLLGDIFFIQSIITWRNRSDIQQYKTWKNETSDIWFATKTDEFLFKQHPVGVNTIEGLEPDQIESNLWVDIPINHDNDGHYHQSLFTKILEASSFKLNWVLDPFARTGGIGVITKKMGRRFIGFESDQDRLLIAMKRIDSE